MFVAMTRVKLKPGTSADVAQLFRQSNPELVREEKDWLGAKMIFDAETDVVTVLATWRTADAYRRLSGSVAFKETMGMFSQFFAGPPEISMNEILVEMAP